MSVHSHEYERCRSFIDSNFIEPQPLKPHRKPVALTISRQAYSRSHEISEALISLLQKDSRLGAQDWALFDRDLVHKILEDHEVPKTVERYMPEDRDRDFSGLINEILGLHPSLWKLFHYTCDTVLKLAKVGNVIIIGRGAHIITRDMPHVLKVRIISPFEQRVERAAKQLNLSPVAASKRLKQDDQAREAFIKSHFDERPDNPLAYHLTLNTGFLSTKAAARILHTALQELV